VRAIRVPLALVPICAYLGVTLLVPALRGAAVRADFAAHAALTLAVAGTLVGLGVASAMLRGSRQRNSTNGDASTLPPRRMRAR
jgi:ACR3 family arsenite efflux pump ArsB